jgi:DNA primase small subunit
MADKDWIGADLIFDLDGDHLPGVSDRDFPGMLDLIQEQAWTLWSEFLHPEFGFTEEHLHVTFSGHRGFHLHYRDPSLVHLDSEARRELVAHIRGEGVDVAGRFARYADASSTGWSRRVREGVAATVATLGSIASNEAAASQHLTRLHDGVQRRRTTEGRSSGPHSKDAIKKLATTLSEHGRSERLLAGNFDVLKDGYRTLFADLVASDTSIVLGAAGETDEVVTIDTRRQIRYPTSLHGKCGMRVSTLPLDRLNPESQNRYDALQEAVVFGSMRDRTMEMTVDDAVFGFHGRRIEASTGERVLVSEAEQVFLSLKGWARTIV